MAPRPRILIVGGYGAFGARAAERLGREADLEIIVAGRSETRASAAAEDLRKTAKAGIGSTAIDATRPDIDALKALAPSVIINASGPFQAQDYTLARAAIAAGAHYIDLADATDFVLGFAADAGLDSAAKAAGVLAVSGASSVPAISGAVLDAYAPRFALLDAMRTGISPGNSFDPGPATTASILSAVGKPFAMKLDGEFRTVHGWQGLARQSFGGLGARWMGWCNVPDLKLFADRYPQMQTIDFRAGVEVPLFHLGLWLLSWPSRWGLLSRPEVLAPMLLAVKRRLPFLGSDAGGMLVELEGTDVNGARRLVRWEMIAKSGHGPYIPTTPAIILARKLARGEKPEPGARACVGLVTLAEIERELSDLDITMSLS